MKSTGLFSLTLAGFFAFAAQSMAQNAIVAEPMAMVQPAVTTGMAGLTTNQTARLSVLNLNSTSITTATLTPPINCTVELQFFYAQNKSLKQAVVPNFAPQTATTLDLKRSEITTQTANRAEIRGQINVNPTSTPVANPTVPGYCTIFTTLQIFDETTGSTVVLTSDTRVTNAGPFVIPLIAQR
jgi:hypothetical protein